MAGKQPRAIPDQEVEAFLDQVDKSRPYLTSTNLINAYKRVQLKVVVDPHSPEIAEAIITALRQREPFSVIRIGDGEGNLLTFGAYPGTPNIDILVARHIISMQQDSFHANRDWLLCLQQLLLQSVLQANIVGVRGFWGFSVETNKSLQVDFDRQAWRKKVSADIRGATGVFRSTDYMLSLAKNQYLKGKIIASAHLYLGIVAHLPELIAAADRVILITDQIDAAKAIRQSFQRPDAELIRVGQPSKKDRNKPPRKPYFLKRICAKLPMNLNGALCLIGSGPWSEIYCSHIKQRGGVAVDLGSGFDLLTGRSTRPIHRRLGLDQDPKYSLINRPSN